MSKNITIALDDVRSALNVGSILRTATAFDVTEVIAGGITPYTKQENDSRLPHIARNTTAKIAKTSLGAEYHIKMVPAENLLKHLMSLKSNGYRIFCLEQAAGSVPLNDLGQLSQDTVLVLGNEVRGIKPEILQLSDNTIEISMSDKKESLNVSISAGIALYHFYNNH